VAELVHAALDPAALAARVARPAAGATLVFHGTTRDHHDGRPVVRLAYEAHDGMALAAIERLEREAPRRFEVLACAIAHRLGEVPVGEASVIVAVSAAHRGPAFDAARWVMDELKRTVPIWKKEHFADGGADWVPGTPLAP
jgi:molybdopterin synthase catalytic subunit